MTVICFIYNGKVNLEPKAAVVTANHEHPLVLNLF